MRKLFALLLLIPSLVFATVTWEKVPQNHSPNNPDQRIWLERAFVPHGWLVRQHYNGTWSITFLPDEYHEWVP